MRKKSKKQEDFLLSIEKNFVSFRV